MRTALARRPTAARALAVVRDKQPAAAPLHARRVAPRAARIGGASIAFIASYAALTALHAAGRDPAPVVALARIPLFARFAASGIAGGAAALLATFLPLETRLLRALPALLAAVTVAAVAAILFCA
jgi:hypothetical protein